MITDTLKKLFGSRNERLLKTYRKSVIQINALEPTIQALSDDALRAKTNEFKARLAQGETLDALLPEAFAVVREASVRVFGMRHFDVQLIGGMALHQGKISEMRTGEGKTLVATLPAYLNALEGKGVHVITVNDYLASRDAAWMGKLYGFLGLSVGCNLSRMPHDQKQSAYASDITYGTNNEFGFDYLRDNMVYSVGERVQRGLNYAIVDEVDSILIDEARTPLIISGQADDHTEMYRKLDGLPKSLVRMKEEQRPGEPEIEGDFYVDEKGHQIQMSESGHEKAEQILSQMGLLPEGASLYDAANISLMHHVMAALRAHNLFHKDQHYVVQNGEVIIVDEFTGRLMPGRRWSDGLHQAVEAKEGVRIQAENQTLASITFQNYFRMYKKLSGMTGTADTEAFEFQSIYGLETVIIPTHRPVQRKDAQDKIYKSAREKYNAILEDIKDCYERGQPVLVGTTSIENSELIATFLEKEKLPHNVLNAKQHEREAEIVAQAGRPKAITIATNMAGRGTDIVLGGNLERELAGIENNPEIDEAQKPALIEKARAEWKLRNQAVLESGGLHIIGCERHESRRIDNQLRGRAGRQGDAGSSRFYLSMEDQLLRIFAGDRVRAIMERLKLPEGEAIEAGIVSRSIESAQRKVEGRNFDIRKQLLEYDDVSNEQRKIIYTQRNEILESDQIRETIGNLRHGALEAVFREYVPEESVEEQWDLAGLENVLRNEYQLEATLVKWLEDDAKSSDEDFLKRVLQMASEVYDAKVQLVGLESFSKFEKTLLLQSIDTHWREHLAALDYLRQGIHLRGYAQKNPKQEYKREAFELFGALLNRVRDEVAKVLLTVRVQSAEQVQQVEQQLEEQASAHLENAQYQHPDAEGDDASVQAEDSAAAAANVPRRVSEKVGRNDPCPCGSGKKYKQCHGKIS
ncbi:preprotein translocase subunit SecA [Limnobacter thiooxidans]|uniref:Protein translocase subunit SecA n=1 Tax=Limnobacter thiooxidans TaxID=131080 RepID=A0AA86MCL1_9BURK|nr:preprotein translocase subunit SecA [Limnobacter sp.]MCZ8016548.1 preprotein translocase subunit SecA [Limnobacter sp.]BET24986.1 preprotein translocase subunit SecA [Limnobacter thiooxidans]